MQLNTNHPFTKSLFKTAITCPAGLYYAKHPEQYADTAKEDDFLKALAEGGFQVGELAKIYEHVEHDLCKVSKHQESLDETEKLLKDDKTVIAEAAFAWENCYVRADIIRKNGNRLDIIEVKAKSFHPDTDQWMGKKQKNTVASGWREYLYDLAFQKYVLTNAFPDYDVHAYLMLADKSRIADINGLNQLFKIEHNNGRSSVTVAPNASEVIAQSKVQLLTAFDVNDIIDLIIAGKTVEQQEYIGKSFVEFVEETRTAWKDNKHLDSKLGAKCFKCQFCGFGEEGDLLDGRDECWKRKAGYEPSKATRPQVSELWGGGGIRRGDWIKNKIYWLDEVTPDIMKLEQNKQQNEGLSSSERRWLQVAIATQDKSLIRYFGKSLNGDTYLDKEGLRKEMDKWVYPLHMIDFETTSVALPFYEGMHPYEQVAFQFSHHIIDRNPDGTYRIYHAGQYLNENVQAFPNFEFVRELRRQLTQDNGTIFRYAAHENSILNAIRKQLIDSNEPDKEELIEFIESITHNKDEKRVGARDMVDLLEIVKRYYYCYSQMHGSNSIKKVLPAVLNSSAFLQKKYSLPIYGSLISSLNVDAANPIPWIYPMPDGTIDNPYHHLPSMASYLDMSDQEVWELEDEEIEEEDMTVANGGAALMAYSKLMFCANGKMEDALRTALLRYCELDTMAMVFIWEYFNHEV